MVLCSYLEYPISVTLYIVITYIFAHFLSFARVQSSGLPLDKQKRRAHRNPVPFFVPKYKLEQRYRVQDVFSLVPSDYLTLAPCPGTECEGCLRKPKHTKEHIKRDSYRCFAKENSENSELKPNLSS